ncbi:glycoside hydrolase/phage tail family protein [Rhizobium sp. L1K21]|uniref:baseplate multidomain protein megatron n=1 Tax=Rhizobium sp. L1K21 TaxID=2954933 RepID=UPI00209327ED|nr:glycoside hydrolase/phage tail family protein [Rhizobium sp. L1K21]MCO6186681.1 glycoside hydrolase/phage tail family protein [Rhizobium sp. L1K21]
MATIVLQAAGAALGSVFGPVGAIVGRAAGALVGSAMDRQLFGKSTTKVVTGSQLSTARIPGADEGIAMTRVYGTARIGGTLFWATRFEEQVTVERSTGGGGGKGGSRSTTTVETQKYYYYANFALGLCEGPIAAVRRVWADGQEIDLSGITMRLYRGTESQEADPLIEAKQGAGNTPAYRGLAYVVFERLPLEAYGNRIPVLEFEVVRAIGALEKNVRAITLIPGATEHGYHPERVTETLSAGEQRIINRNVSYAYSDWTASLDELQALCPNLERVTLIVSWFGDDLRVGVCTVQPGVEVPTRSNESSPWRVSGVERGGAYLVSRSNGAAAYGGTPSDASVVAAIRDLKARGLKVFLHPFILMDVPAGNGKTDPYGAGEQATYPWRGRITCHPAAGIAGSTDKSADARAQVEAFLGSAAPGDFNTNGTEVNYSGAEKSYRRMMLHYAKLAAVAGGVEGFLIGSELRGLTRIRDAANAFPFVEGLVRLAGDVRAVLGSGTAVTYAADWSEYFGYQPQDGSGEVWFNLDPLWASSHIDAVGIDNYMPLADWRDDDLSAANPDGMTAADDVAGLQAAITSGEGFDWYYASAADRESRLRSAITDGLAGKPWVYRYKDIEGWWSNRHYNRVGGVEASAPTAWTARAKPIWFMELGCPAIDRGANQPNVFVDAKSSESAYPYFSGGARNDSQQRRFLDAHLGWWTSTAAPAGMVDPGHVFLWTWDARPSPAFPENTSLFADGVNWHKGHWLNGRLGAGTQAEIIAAILKDHGFADFDVNGVSGDLTGYVQGDVTSARELLQPIMEAFQIGVAERAGVLTFFSRSKRSLSAQVIDVVADIEDEPLWQEKRAQESDLSGQAILDHYDEAGGYDRAVARSRKVSAASDRILRVALNGALAEPTAAAAAEELLRDHRVQRRSISFRLPPTALELEPGDTLNMAELDGTFLVSRIEDGESRVVEAGEYTPSHAVSTYEAVSRRIESQQASAAFDPVIHLMDLPKLGTGNAVDFACAAAFVAPWRALTLLSSATDEGYAARVTLRTPAVIGVLKTALEPGVASRIDHAQALNVQVTSGGFSAAEEVQVLNGKNRLAVQSSTGVWEVVSFINAEQVESGSWRLTGLIRGQGGTEDAMVAGALEGAPVVLLDEAVKSLGLDQSEAGLALNWYGEAGDQQSERMPFTGGVRAQTPLAPVHLKAFRESGGTRFYWVRRGREDADNWAAYEIPLDEPEERYLVEVMSGGNVVRRAEADEPGFFYAMADELADFGMEQSELTLRVRQLGWSVAQGLAATKTFIL